MPRIFVSYRREDAEGEAGRLFDDLVSRFGEDSVFLDVAAIEVGRDFRKAIDESVATCSVLLAIIGKDWIDVKSESGQRRLDDPADFVRLETASALKRDIPVIPVLVQGAKMPHSEQLPDDLKELAYRNGVELTHARWRSDLDLLAKALRRHVEIPQKAEEPASKPVPRQVPVQPPPVPTKDADKTPVPRQKFRVPILLGIFLAAIVVAALAFWLWPRQQVVPDLTGSTLSDAISKLEAAKLVVGNKTYQEDANKTPDTVLSQSPPPNTRVKSGTPVDIVLVEGTVEVPPLTGKSLDSARTALQDAHLAVGTISKEPRSDVGQNTVLDEFPQSGKRVALGTAIDLVVSQASANPAPNAIQPLEGSKKKSARANADLGASKGGNPAPSQLARVPNLFGMSLDQARRQLKASGLEAGKVTFRPRAGADPGIVLSQEPGPDQQVQPGALVNLTATEPLKQSSVQSSLPNFAGTWEMFEYTFNGKLMAVPNKPMTITQDGSIVHIGGRDYGLTSEGTVTFQKFRSVDPKDKTSHEVATAGEAELVTTFTWGIKDSTLVYEIISDFRRQYGDHPRGKDVAIIKYRRIAP